MASPKLSVSRLIAIAISLTPAGAQAQSLSTLLLLSTVNTIDNVERFRDYTSAAAVGLDFGTSSGAYKVAVKYFSQSPKPRKLMVGKWCRSSTEGGLRGGVVSAVDQNYLTWTGITNGAFDITVDGGAVQHITGLNFSAATSMDGVAAIIDAAITGADCVWESTFNRFTFRSQSTGAASSVAFLVNAGSGTNIADNLKGRSTDSGSYQYPGQTAESSTAVINFFDQYYGQRWYGVGASFESDADRLNFAAAVEALTNKHLYFTTTQDSACLLPNNTTDIAAELAALGYTRTFLQYSSTDPFAVFSAAAKLLSVDYTAQNTTLTLMFKQEPGVVAELLNETQVGSLEKKHCNVFVAYDNETNILQRGEMVGGIFADIVSGTDWLAVTCQTELWNVLYTTPTKIPQTDEGINLLVGKCEAVCSQAVRNGLLAPGVWNSQGFGTLQEGDYLSKGFYVFAPRVDSQLETDRAARKAPTIQIAAKLAGAVHEVAVNVVVNQ